MKGGLARPGQEVGAALELVKAAPQDHLGLLQDVIRIMRCGHHAVNVHAQRAVVAREQFEEFLGAVRGGHGVDSYMRRRPGSFGQDICGGEGSLRLLAIVCNGLRLSQKKPEAEAGMVRREG